jgi:Leucine-rich repeat (LRR) protein
MPTTLSCPACGLQQRIDDSGRGALRCRECGEVLLPDAQAADPRFAGQELRRASWRDPDDEDHPPRQQGSAGKVLAWVLAAVGGAMLLVVLGCAGAIYLLISRATVTVNPPGPVANPGPPINPGDNPPPAGIPVWSVRADPGPLPPARVTRPERTAKLGTAIPYSALVPGSPSPFLASGSNDVPTNHREVWDLRTMEKVGELRGFRLRTHGELTPDGAYLAGRLNEGRGGYVVYSCKDGAKAFELNDRDLTFLDFYGFAGSRKFLVVTTRPRQACHAFEVPGGRKLRQFQTEEHQDSEPWATSPGGKYLALMCRDAVHLYDLDQGTPAGRIVAPVSWRSAHHHEMMFSADGKELALLSESNRGTNIDSWDLVGNRLACSYSIPASTLSRMKTRGKYFGRHLEWLDDGSGWLLRGEVLIDRRTGKAVWQMDPGDTPHYVRHVVGSTHVTRFKGALAKEGMELVEIRRGEGGLAQLPPGGVNPPAGGAAPPSKEEAAAEAALRKVAYHIRRDPKLPGNPVVEVTFLPNKATDADLAHLSAFPKLRKVLLIRAKITDDGINELKKLPNLEDLNLTGCKALTDKGFARVGELKGLRSLSLSSTNITNDSVALLKGLTRLEKLNLSTTRVDDGALAHLEGMTELRELNLFNVGELGKKRVTDAGLEHLKGLTKLEVLLIPNSKVTGKGMAYLEGMTGLRHLNLFNTLVDDAGLQHLKGLTKLEILEMPSTRFTDDGLAALAGMKQLRKLDLGFSKLTDKGMAHLKGLTELRELTVGYTAVSDAGLAHLKGLTKLTHLDVVTGKVTDAGLVHLAGCKDLFILSASGEGITDAGLAHLKGLKRLSSLYLDRTKVTAAGVADLKKSLPRVGVYTK